MTKKKLNDAWVAACHVPVLISVIMWDMLSKIMSIIDQTYMDIKVIGQRSR